MTLLTCVFAAIICLILWYKHAPDNTMRLGTLSLMYWGASLMLSLIHISEPTRPY